MKPYTGNEAMVSNGLSAEQLGAYMEGNLPENEMVEVENMINDDPQIAELYEDVNNTNIDWDADILEDYPDFEDNFDMPEVETTDYHNFQYDGNGPESMSEYDHVQVPEEDGPGTIENNTDDQPYDEDNTQDYPAEEYEEEPSDEADYPESGNQENISQEVYDESNEDLVDF